MPKVLLDVTKNAYVRAGIGDAYAGLHEHDEACWFLRQGPEIAGLDLIHVLGQAVVAPERC